MTDLSQGLAVLGLGLVMFLWGYDKVWAQKHPERVERFAWGLLVAGLIYIFLSAYLLFQSL